MRHRDSPVPDADPGLTQRTLVRQTHEEGCGPACGEMLLRDRGLEIDQQTIARGLALPVTAEHLARRLTELSSLRWLGAYISLENGASWDFVAGLTAERGSWAALLEPAGFRASGHWVVVDAVSEDGLVGVRDPAGEALFLPMDQFLALWRYTVMVIEEVP